MISKLIKLGNQVAGFFCIILILSFDYLCKNVMPKLSPPEKTELDLHRESLLYQVEKMMRGPMIVLGFIWVVLVFLQFNQGLSSTLKILTTVIWIIFILDFILRFSLAPKKKEFLKNNWLTTLALIVPALRIFQFIGMLRLLAASGGLSLVQAVGTMSRGMRALGETLGRRGFKYISLLTLIVTFLGAAAIYGFENNIPEPGGIHDYGTAVYFTIMMITTIGSDYWPRTPGGKVLTVILSLYAVAILGYIAASLATFFIDREAESPQAPVPSEKSIQKVLEEVRALRQEIIELKEMKN
jgi:voltage-gated potassium channel